MNNKASEKLAGLTMAITEKYAYDMGYDAGKNGANEENCDFRIFSKPENTRAWERGNKKGLLEKK